MKSKDFPQIEMMRFGVDYSFEISCRNFKVRVRPLTNLEIIQATADAAEAFAKLPDGHKISVSSSLLNAMYQLERAASQDVGDTSQLSLAMLQMITPEEVNYLWKQYVRVVDRVNPDFEKMSTEDFNALVTSLKKSSDRRSLLTDLSISNLIELSEYLLNLQPG